MIQKNTKRRLPKVKPNKAYQDVVFSYKDVNTLEKFMTEQGYIVARARTGLSQKQQRHLAVAIKRARHLGLLPFTQTI